MHFTCVLVFKFNLLLGANIFVGYESLSNFTKEKNTHKIRGKEGTRREDQYSIERQHPKTQKHPMAVIKKEQCGALNGDKQTTYS